MAKRTQKKSYLGTILLSRRAMRARASRFSILAPWCPCNLIHQWLA